jgi:hypothetical protein
MSLLERKPGLQSLLSADEDDVNFKGGPFDQTNPRSLINIAPEVVVTVLLEKMPVPYLYMTESALEKQFRPSADLQKIRVAFWKEYESAQSELRRMSLGNIGRYLGYPSLVIIRSLKDVEKLAVILCPVTSYDNFLEESLMAGSRRLREIIDLPFFKDDGTPDHKTMELVLKAIAFIDMRKHGGIVQKQLSVNMDKKSSKELIGNASIEEIDRKIKELEQADNIGIKTMDKVINEYETSFSGKTTPLGEAEG